MKRIAFVVEPEYGEKHFGVRNYFNTIYQALSEQYDVDYISFFIDKHGISWYRVLEDKRPCDVETKEIVIKQKKLKRFSYKNYISMSKTNSNLKKCYYFQYLGRNLRDEKYDACIITNPWLISPYIRIDALKKIGIVYDLVPNIYAIEKTMPPIEFASEHNVGYRFYNEFCDAIISISEQTMNLYRASYSQSSGKLYAFPAFMPFQFEHSEKGTAINKENAIILAAPFDLRKGLKRIPKLVNAQKEYIDKLYIFGQMRCMIEDFNQFFEEIDSDIEISYFPTISYKDLISLYRKSKVLLFPSEEEGLGLPIIEAQVCGCRVVTTDAMPMNQLTLNGSCLLSDNDSDNAEKIKRMLLEEFNYDELMQTAIRMFSVTNVVKLINEIVEQL